MKPLDSIFAIRLTSDLDAVRQAIQTFDGRKAAVRAAQRLRAQLHRRHAGAHRRIRNQVAWSAINALAVHMGGLADARKTLDRRREHGRAGAAPRSGVSGHARHRAAIRQPRQRRDLHDRPGPTTRCARDADPLRTLAPETDGAAIAGDLDAGLRRAAADSSRYYLLTYRSDRPDDGRFREVVVRTTARRHPAARAERVTWDRRRTIRSGRRLLARSERTEEAGAARSRRRMSAR